MKTSENNNESQRQHINLSYRAFDVISNDLIVFSPQHLTLSGYINYILESFIEESDATISMAIERKRKYYTDSLLEHRNKPLSDSELQTIDTLVEKYKETLISKYTSYPKEKTLKIRLNNYVFDYFNPTNINEKPNWMKEEPIYLTQGSYIKAILEDFTTKPLFEREKYIFNNTYSTLILALKNNDLESRHLVKISYYSAYKNQTSNYFVKPYLLTTDNESQYNYLIGLSKESNSDLNKYIPAVFRLSRISRIQVISSKSGKITKEEKKLIETELRAKGVQFIMDEEKQYKVRLTPEGMRKYNIITHLRPISDMKKTEIDGQGNYILYFYCTSMQMYNYFFKFGKDAIILESRDLANKFKKEYLAALHNYD